MCNVLRVFNKIIIIIVIIILHLEAHEFILHPIKAIFLHKITHQHTHFAVNVSENNRQIKVKYT